MGMSEARGSAGSGVRTPPRGGALPTIVGGVLLLVAGVALGLGMMGPLGRLRDRTMNFPNDWAPFISPNLWWALGGVATAAVALGLYAPIRRGRAPTRIGPFTVLTFGIGIGAFVGGWWLPEPVTVGSRTDSVSGASVGWMIDDWVAYTMIWWIPALFLALALSGLRQGFRADAQQFDADGFDAEPAARPVPAPAAYAAGPNTGSRFAPGAHSGTGSAGRPADGSAPSGASAHVARSGPALGAGRGAAPTVPAADPEPAVGQHPGEAIDMGVGRHDPRRAYARVLTMRSEPTLALPQTTVTMLGVEVRPDEGGEVFRSELTVNFEPSSPHWARFCFVGALIPVLFYPDDLDEVILDPAALSPR